MKLISVYIENFGKLHQETITFTEGLNTQVHENGWGKTTLSVFIRVMFFGFLKEGKRSEVENERKRYQPWQQGTYGGTLTFETQGRRYRIERTFADRKNDTFALYDADTNLPSDAFGTDIGRELFFIDAESFAKTIWVGQQDAWTTVTDAMQAKIGNRSEDPDDIGALEPALKTLKDEENRLSDKRKTGLISRNKEEIARLETKLLPLQTLPQRFAELSTRVKELEEEQAALSEAEASCREALLKEEEDGRLLEERLQWEALIREEATAKTSLHKIKAQIPADGDLNEQNLVRQIGRIRQADAFLQKAETLALSQEEENFLTGISDAYLSPKVPQQLSHAAARWDGYKKLKQKLEEIPPQPEGIPVRRMVWQIASITGILAGIFCLFLAFGFSMLPAGVGFLVLTLSAILLIAEKASGSKQGRQGMQTQAQEMQSRLESYRVYLVRFLEHFGYTWQDSEVSGYLVQIQNDYRRAVQLTDKRQQHRQMMHEADTLKKEIERFYVNHKVPANNRTKEQLELLSLNIVKCRELEAALADRSRARVQFEEALGVDKLGEIREFEKSKRRSGSDGLQKMTQIQAQMQENLRQRHLLDTQRSRLQEEEKSLDELRAKKVQLEEETASLASHYELVQLTRSYLEEAAVRYRSGYVLPIRQAFSSYYEALTGEDAGTLEMDANLDLHMRTYGMQKDAALLSEGYQDLIGICRRLAMIRVMYPAEKPFLILDDPFVNLDEEKQALARRMLHEIAKEYQVLYFTCHKSRT